MPNERILLIEDDPAIVAGLEMNLSLEGYEVVSARDGDSGLKRVEDGKPDLILLDIMLPKRNGLEVLRRIRAHNAEIPVLIISARGDESDKVLGLELGADDYISKPFSVSELRARINARLRRKRVGAAGRQLEGFGEVRVDCERYRVTRAGKEVPMTAREFAVLAYFLRNPDRVITRDMLLHAVWKLEFSTLRTVDNFIARLRAKLEPDPDNPRYLLTVRGVGYRFEPEGGGAG
ncbi:MAG: response regulator transcription factor [Deltaproteobacteria bacterium]|nr:response regulator transcription factor [Deltaproteobacteria bacterium]